MRSDHGRVAFLKRLRQSKYFFLCPTRFTLWGGRGRRWHRALPEEGENVADGTCDVTGQLMINWNMNQETMQPHWETNENRPFQRCGRRRHPDDDQQVEERRADDVADAAVAVHHERREDRAEQLRRRT